MAVDGAARAVVVLPYPDMQWAGGAADVGGRAVLTFEAVDTIGDEAQVTE